MLLLTDQISLLSYHTRSNSTQTRHACTHDILGVFVVVFFPVGLWWDRRTNGRTDRRTPYRFRDPAPHTTRAVPINVIIKSQDNYKKVKFITALVWSEKKQTNGQFICRSVADRMMFVQFICFWHSRHSMRRRVYETVPCPSVLLIGPAGRRHRSYAAFSFYACAW